MVLVKQFNQLTVARQLRICTSFPFNYLRINKPRRVKDMNYLIMIEFILKIKILKYGLMSMEEIYYYS